MGNTKIEWATRVWNPVTGCTKISPGCHNCYAERLSKRFCDTWGLPHGNPFKVTLHPNRLDQPFNWKKPQRIFVCSMSDLFHDDVPDDFIMKVFNQMANAQLSYGHIFMVLTKRPDRMLKIIQAIEADIMEQRKPIKNSDGTTTRHLTFHFPLQRIWLGVTAENQEQANKRIPILLQIPAERRFVSVEPMLSEININRYLKWPLCKEWSADGNPIEYGKYRWVKQRLVSSGWVGLDWVICGGESGLGARPMHPNWARNLRDQCQAAKVPFFFKQWGEWGQLEGSGAGNPTPICFWNEESDNWMPGISTHTQNMVHVGKKKAGRMLDGREWLQF